MKRLLLLTVLTCACGTDADPELNSAPERSVGPESVEWTEVDSTDVAGFNAGVVPGKLTLDVGVYYPSNLDPSFDKVTLERVMQSLEAAREIYEPTGVQIRLLWVKTGVVEPRFLAIQSSEVPGVPNGGYVNLYEHMRRHPARLTAEAEAAFESIVEPHPENARTVYLVVLQDVFYPFLEVDEGRNWMMKTVRTGGLSFPAYSHVEEIPERLRGVITLSNLARPDRFRRTIAHEIGHKVINVSHEYRETDPEHEVYADGGLMVYGDGEEIPAGEAGRWQLERLRLSPFLYVLNEDGSRTWNRGYEEGGHYYDPLYGDYVVHFEGTPPIAEDW